LPEQIAPDEGRQSTDRIERSTGNGRSRAAQLARRVETAQVYRDLAEREQDEKRRGILLRMAKAEERHAARWEEKLRDMGEPVRSVKTLLLVGYYPSERFSQIRATKSRSWDCFVGQIN